jgi:uncharacterized protein YndB with AHSA1/START domain
MPTLTLVHEFSAPADRLYAALADQDGMARWMAAPISVPVRTPELVGTVRRIGVGALTFDERIVAVEPGRSIAYVIATPLPGLVHHHGEMHVEALGAARSRLRWHITMEFSPALFATPVLGGLRLVLGVALKRLAKQLAS